jgi:uncharacterized membrane protein YqjE
MTETKVSRVKSLLRTLAFYAEARGRLLQIEAQEAGSKLSGIVILVVVLCGCLLFGWLLALPPLVWLLAEFFGWQWWQVALGGAGGHLLLALVFFISLRVRLRKLRVFEETLRQFEKDRALIGNSASRP